MEKLLAYLNSLSTTEQVAFASACGTSVGYLRKAISKGQLFRGALCIDIERESNRRVTCEDLQPDVDWKYLRGTEKDA
jgi:DNA-binding transcriptional regulator YdaS (Cro superfamily)